jgi:hypothetical protein
MISRAINNGDGIILNEFSHISDIAFAYSVHYIAGQNKSISAKIKSSSPPSPCPNGKRFDDETVGKRDEKIDEPFSPPLLSPFASWTEGLSDMGLSSSVCGVLRVISSSPLTTFPPTADTHNKLTIKIKLRVKIKTFLI